jgi:type IV pilus assembly protein PilY1
MSIYRYRLLLASLFGVMVVTTPAVLKAEDIDIFARINGTNDLPNVLIVWDSSANWTSSIPVPDCSYLDEGVPRVQEPTQPMATNPGKEQGKKLAIEKCAIHNVIDALPTDANGAARFNVGLMLFNESPAANSGGYPRVQFLPLDSANKEVLKDAIRRITIGDDKGNNAAFSKALYEAWLMFSKGTPYKGTAGAKWDRNAVSGGKYVGPPGSGCGKNHIIFVANGGPGEVTDNQARDLLAAAGGSTTALTYPTSLIGNSDQGNWADEYARFLRGVDVSSMDGVQSITTHGVAVTGASSDGKYPNFIRAMATQGGGQYYEASDIAKLVESLLAIFNSIATTNSVFASAALPISVNAQGTHANQVFVGMFRPDELARPRWVGNLKQYQIVYNRATDSLSLGDSLGNSALNAATGFIQPGAISYWTQKSNFWVNDLKGTPPSANDLPDGEIVEKGGAAQVLRSALATSQDPRSVYTCIGCSAGTTLSAAGSTRFMATNMAITRALLGAADSDERTQLINWVRGTDNAADERGPGSPTTIRPTVHGDILHSRPAVVDFGGSTGVIVFYGANDGMLHAIDGNRTGATPGQELWAFVPEEFLGRFKRLRDNKPEILFPSTPTGTKAERRDYFVDGSVTVYQKLDSSRATEQVILYVTMRRGGRFLYAFDVTKPTDPKLLWRTSSTEIPNLGQTWSDPQVSMVRGRTSPVLVIGAGYDAAAEDLVPPGTTTMGNAVLVLDALDGSLVKALSTDRSMPASVALMDSDFDGYADRGYAVDMGANVYRIDFETALGDKSADSWRLTKIASLNETGSTRKFFFAPDLVQTKEFTALLVGSGNRENPLATVSNDRFYTLLDHKTTKGAPVSTSPVTNASLVANADGMRYSDSLSGCYLALGTDGEKVVTAAVSTGGNTYFSTNKPRGDRPTNSCAADLGTATTYRMPLFCGLPATLELASGGLPPSPVIGLVDIKIPSEESGKPDETRSVPFIIGGFNAELSGLAVTRVPINVDPTRRRTYWFTNKGR